MQSFFVFRLSIFRLGVAILPVAVSEVTGSKLSVLIRMRTTRSGEALPSDVQGSLLADLHGGDALVPTCCLQLTTCSGACVKGPDRRSTFDDLTDADLAFKSTPPDRGIESRRGHCQSQELIC